MVDVQLAGALVEGVHRLVVPVVADQELGLYENLVARNAGVAKGMPDPALVAVGCSGVDVPVAELERGGDRGAGLLGRCLEDAQTEGRHLDAVVQRQGLDHGSF